MAQQSRRLTRWFALAWLCATTAQAAPPPAAEPELLEPEQAFAFEARATGPDTITATWRIADGYYIYRNKIRLEADGAQVLEVSTPPGKIKKDDYFGEVEVYYHTATATMKVKAAAGATVTVTGHSQGCSEVLGVCYMPLSQTAKVQLPAAAPAEKAAAPSSLSGLTKLLDRGAALPESPQFLHPDKAFELSIAAADADTVRARIEIADGYYLYRDKTRFSIAGEGAALGQYTLPPGEKKVDEYFGEVEIYHKVLDVTLPVTRAPGSAGGVDVTAEYQGCAEGGICYPPIKHTVKVELPAAGATPATPPGAAKPAPAQPAAAPLAEDEHFRVLLEQRNFWAVIGAFFVAGLLLTFTPCVFPMIPILSGIIVGQGREITTSRAFVLSLVYVIAMAVTYTVAGVAAALFGQNLQAAFQDPWVLSIFALVFVALAFSMFGFYDLQLPSALQSRLTELSNRQQGGTFAGVAVMGVLSALIVGPCVAAPLAGALIYIGGSGDALLGGTALFAMSMGMGMPLLAVGTSAGKVLPRAGPWMDAVKATFGVLLLGVAVWMISRIVPPQVSLVLFALLLVIPAIYMHALDPLPAAATGWARLWKGVGVVLLVLGLMLLVGAFTGARDPLDPLSGLRAGVSAGAGVPGAGPAPAAATAKFETVRNRADLDARIAAAGAGGRPVLLDFYADWCVECVRMENTTFHDPQVQEAMSRFALLRADVTATGPDDKAMLEAFQLFGPPALLFFDRHGKEMRARRFIGYMKAPEFRALLGQVADEAVR